MEKEFDMKNISGLSQAEVERIIKADGYNELPSQRKRGAFSILLKVLSEPMLFLLVAGGAVYFFLGEMKDALMLLEFQNQVFKFKMVDFQIKANSV